MTQEIKPEPYFLIVNLKNREIRECETRPEVDAYLGGLLADLSDTEDIRVFVVDRELFLADEIFLADMGEYWKWHKREPNDV